MNYIVTVCELCNYVNYVIRSSFQGSKIYIEIGQGYPLTMSCQNIISPLTCQRTRYRSLGQVTIQQQENIETIQFELDKTTAFEGTENNKGQALEIKEVTQDPQTKTINVSFEPPVPPDTTFSISLQAKQNPSDGGIYLFTVYAFPAGDNPMGLDLGVGRLQFDQPY